MFCIVPCVKCMSVLMLSGNENRLSWLKTACVSPEENAKKEGVSTTESGLRHSSVINQGDGAIPARTDRVRVHYTGRLI